MAKQQSFNPSPYIAALFKVVNAMQMPAAERSAILQALERHRVHVANQKYYAKLAPRTPEQRARKAAATRRWRERKATALVTSVGSA